MVYQGLLLSERKRLRTESIEEHVTPNSAPAQWPGNKVLALPFWGYYITCYLLDAFIQSDLHTQYCGQSPKEQIGVKCLAQGHNDMLTAVGFEPVHP